MINVTHKCVVSKIFLLLVFDISKENIREFINENKNYGAK